MAEELHLADFASGHNKFSETVYRELIKSKNGNLLVCPLSADIILALVHAGAGGETAEQLSNALYLPKTPEKIKQTFRELGTLLQHNEGYTFNSANKVYVKDGYEIQDQFRKTAVEDFLAEIQNIDFGKKQEAASEINKWVEEKTSGKIRNMVKAGELAVTTRAILINAMYFHGQWRDMFRKDLTSKQPFYLNDEDQKDVDMMRQTSYLDYCEDSKLNAKFLMMSYRGGDVTMTFVLPNEKNGLAALEADISEVFKAPTYSHERVIVAIPKFKIETDIDLIPILKALGIADAFTTTADFRGILVKEPLIIDQVFQKAFIDVHEEGTTAAAATKIAMRKYCSRHMPEPKEFVADHPFIFALRINGIVFFVGRCVSPTY